MFLSEVPKGQKGYRTYTTGEQLELLTATCYVRQQGRTLIYFSARGGGEGFVSG